MKYFIVLFFISFNLFAQLPAIQYFQIQKSKIALYSNVDLKSNNAEVEQAIITVHGSERNADTYFRSIHSLVTQRNENDKTIFIAPKFKTHGDTLASSELLFSYEGWWIGDVSLNLSKVSSFSVIDVLLERLGNRQSFPKLKRIVLTGHSAGGHLTQRYALGTIIDNKLSHLKIRYVVANPGTYAYLNDSRPVINSPGVFARPQLPGCAYNHYKYGLENLNAYMSKNNLQKLIMNYLQKDVVYFLGEADTGSVEQSCQAKLQGRHRYERGINFYDHMTTFYPAHNHSLVTVPDVGHTQYGMYTSSMGKDILFD